GNVVTGGKRHSNQGFFYEPTIVTDVPDDSKVMTQEPFGPIAPIVTFKTFDEVVERANSLPYGLAAYAFTSSNTTAAASRGRDRRRDRVRDGGRQLGCRLDAGNAVRRGEGIGPRQRRRHRGTRRLPQHQVHFAGVAAAAFELSLWPHAEEHRRSGTSAHSRASGNPVLSN